MREERINPWIKKVHAIPLTISYTFLSILSRFSPWSPLLVLSAY